MFYNFTLGDFIFTAVVTIGTGLIVYFSSRGRKD